MRKLMRRANSNFKREAFFEDDRDMLSYEPVIMDGNSSETVIWFTSDFSDTNIYKLIQDIEQVKQADYKKLTLYFSSAGGSIDSLRVLANYLNNNIGDLNIDIRVVGLVASAGFYILIMAENQNINIIFDETASGLIHLADCRVSQRSLLSKDNARYDAEQHFIKGVTNLNDWLTEKYLDKLALKEEDREMLQQGKDVMLESSELSRIVNEFRTTQYLESDACQEEIADLMMLYAEVKDRIECLTGKSPEKLIEDICGEVSEGFEIDEMISEEE